MPKQLNLSLEIESKRKEIKTDGYPMSIGEWISLYEKNEIDIHPEFQRIYRWSETQKTNLIESILLGIPIPPIFVSQRQDGIWDVIDGLQRLSTIFQFVGILKDENKKNLEPLILKKTKYLPSLNGIMWNNPKNPTSELPNDLKLSIKRSKISVSIVLKESDENSKYDLFQRLNTGGSALSPQEVRNCLLVMANKKMFTWINELGNYKKFKEVASVSERLEQESYNLELVLRFILLYNLDTLGQKSIGDVGEFITEKMVEISKNKKYQYKKQKEIFEKTFDILHKTINENAFKKYNKIKRKHEGAFLVSMFETVALGIAYNINKETLIHESKIAGAIKSLWSNNEFIAMASPGINSSRRIIKLLPLGRSTFSKETK